MKIYVVISHVKLKYFHLIYPYIRFIRKMACESFRREPPIFHPGPTLVANGSHIGRPSEE